MGMRRNIMVASVLLAAGGSALAQGPAFSCDKVAAGSMEALICQDAALSALDRQLAALYAEASQTAASDPYSLLKAEQRGWLKGRDECWKSEDKPACVARSYRQRIVELQAHYHLVASTGPFTWQCDGDPRNEVVTTFFQTEPPSLIAERGDSSALMTLQPSGSGSKYEGRNESFWEHQGEAAIVWGYGAPQMHCKKLP